MVRGIYFLNFELKNSQNFSSGTRHHYRNYFHITREFLKAVSYEKREGSNHATSLRNKYSHNQALQDLNVSGSKCHIENFDYRSNSPCESSVQLNVSRKGVWPINSRCSLISLNLAKDKFGKGGFEGLLSGFYSSSYCAKTRSALYLQGLYLLPYC